MNYFIIYIIGYVLAYAYTVIYAKFLDDQKPVWTLKDRLITMLISLFSWLWLAFGIIMTIAERFGKINWDKEVKW